MFHNFFLRRTGAPPPYLPKQRQKTSSENHKHFFFFCVSRASRITPGQSKRRSCAEKFRSFLKWQWCPKFKIRSLPISELGPGNQFFQLYQKRREVLEKLRYFFKNLRIRSLPFRRFLIRKSCQNLKIRSLPISEFWEWDQETTFHISTENGAKLFKNLRIRSLPKISNPRSSRRKNLVTPGRQNTFYLQVLYLVILALPFEK